jgi:hypothetical protein
MPQIARLVADEREGPVVLLNLNRYRARAAYPAWPCTSDSGFAALIACSASAEPGLRLRADLEP